MTSGDPMPRRDPSPAAREEGARAAVTGLGVVSPLGLGVDELWSGLVEGRSARVPHPPSPRGIAVPPGAGLLGAVAERARTLVDARRLRRVSRLSLYAVAAADLAFRDATGSSGLAHRPDADSTGVILGTSFGSSDYHFDYYEKLYRGGLREASPLLFSESVMNAASGHVSLHFGLRGPSLALVGGEEVGLEAVADAADRLELGEVSAVLAGGGEESCDFVQAALLHSGFLSDAGDASLSLEANQLDFSEGAALLLLERETEANARGQRVLARLLGRGAARRTKAGAGVRERVAAAALRQALDEAGVAPGEIGLVVASAGAGSDQGAIERAAVDRVLGPAPERVVLAPKTMLGEGFASTSALQAVIAVEALRRGRAPRTESSPPLRYALVLSVNRRGAAVAVVFGA